MPTGHFSLESVAQAVCQWIVSCGKMDLACSKVPSENSLRKVKPLAKANKGKWKHVQKGTRVRFFMCVATLQKQKGAKEKDNRDIPSFDSRDSLGTAVYVIRLILGTECESSYLLFLHGRFSIPMGIIGLVQPSDISSND